MADRRDSIDELDDSGLEVTSSERMQRMKKLMRQLYQEEEATHIVKLPAIKAKNLVLYASIGAVLVMIMTTFYHANRFITAQEQVYSARAHIHDALQRRSNLFGNLVNLTLNHAMLEQEVFRYVSDGRVGMMSPDARPAPDTTPATPMSALSRLMGLVEQYPDIKTSTTYQQLMDKLMDLENMISKRRDDYNEQVRVYNTSIRSFPWWFMAKVMGFKQMEYFASGTGPDDKFTVLDSNKFLRLIPEMEFDNGLRRERLHHRSESQEKTDPGKEKGVQSGASVIKPPEEQPKARMTAEPPVVAGPLLPLVAVPAVEHPIVSGRDPAVPGGDPAGLGRDPAVSGQDLENPVIHQPGQEGLPPPVEADKL